jgi:hypothetical protein
MGDYEGVPSKWDWSDSIDEVDLKGALADSESRLISVHRPDGAAAVPLSAVWIANKGADKTGWNWSPGTNAATLDGLVKKAKGRLIHIDAFTVTGTGVQFAGVWVSNTGSFERELGLGPRTHERGAATQGGSDPAHRLLDHVCRGREAALRGRLGAEHGSRAPRLGLGAGRHVRGVAPEARGPPRPAGVGRHLRAGRRPAVCRRLGGRR